MSPRMSCLELAHKPAHKIGVNPSIETKYDWHTCRLTIFPSQIASSPPQWSSAGEAEAGSGGDQPAKE
jgi:hypothetical protein